MNFCLGVTLPRQRNSDQLILARAPSPDGHLLAGIAEFEAGLLTERVKSRPARAKAKGKKLGRKEGDMPAVRHNFAAVRQYASEGKSQRWIAKELQIDRKTVRKIIQLIGDPLPIAE